MTARDGGNAVAPAHTVAYLLHGILSCARDIPYVLYTNKKAAEAAYKSMLLLLLFQLIPVLEAAESRKRITPVQNLSSHQKSLEPWLSNPILTIYILLIDLACYLYH